MVFIHIGFSWATFGTLLPDPWFRVRVSHIHHVRVSFDAPPDPPCTAPSAFTQNGDLDERRFDYVFSMYSTPPHTHLTFAEGVRMLRGNRNVCDLFGWFAAACDWGATYLLLWPSDGRVTKQDVHDIMDGSLFPKLAQKIRNANKA
ncbi:Caleosin [Mycena leptocephala]|nr:Caleosin [Mycena leptocephala]